MIRLSTLRATALIAPALLAACGGGGAGQFGGELPDTYAARQGHYSAMQDAFNEGVDPGLLPDEGTVTYAGIAGVMATDGDVVEISYGTTEIAMNFNTGAMDGTMSGFVNEADEVTATELTIDGIFFAAEASLFTVEGEIEVAGEMHDALAVGGLGVFAGEDAEFYGGSAFGSLEQDAMESGGFQTGFVVQAQP